MLCQSTSDSHVCVEGGGGQEREEALSKRSPIFSVWDGVYSIVQSLGRGTNIPVWKGVSACLEMS